MSRRYEKTKTTSGYNDEVAAGENLTPPTFIEDDDGLIFDVPKGIQRTKSARELFGLREGETLAVAA